MPKRLLRSVIDCEGKPDPANLRVNFQRLKDSSLEWAKPADKQIYRFILGYWELHLECPALQVLVDHFGSLDEIEVLERLKEIQEADVYLHANFGHLLKGLVDEQNKIKAIALIKEAQDIVVKGVSIGQGRNQIRKEGIRDAILHLTENAYSLIQDGSTAKTRGDIVTDTKAGWDEYQTAKNEKHKVWGRFTGLEAIDTICRGHRAGELWVHAGFTGELKCLTGDTTIYDHKTNCKRTLAELFASQEAPTVTSVENEGSTYRLVRAPASQVVENGIKNVYELRLSSGRRITATLNHPFLTPDGWKRLEELSPTDLIAVPKQLQCEGKAIFTDAEVKVVGYLLGDGHIRNYISFTAKNEVIREDFKAQLIELGLLEGAADFETANFREELGDDRYCVRVSCSSGDKHHPQVSPIRVLLDSLGLYGKLSADKFIPVEFFSLPDDQVSLLLGALWSTDGSCHYGDHSRTDRQNDSRRYDIKYSSISESLCLGVQSLLLRLGIQSSLTKAIIEVNGDPYSFYTVTVVTNPSKRTFVETIQVVGKEEQFARLYSRLPKTDNTPIPTVFVPEDAKVSLPWGGYRYAIQMRNRVMLGRDTARLFLDYPSVSKVYEGDLNWEPVESITMRGAEMTYDLSVPTHRSFIANDIVVHNSTFAMNWAYNLVTRYRANVLYISLEVPYNQARRIIQTMHTSNLKWINQGKKPLDYRKVRDGELSPDEEAFFKEALEDFENNPEYCSLECVSPDKDCTIDDIRAEAELMHKKKELGFIVIDHGGLVEAKKNRHFKDYTIALNSVLRDAKKLALQFNHGQGIPVLMLFQLNRQGKNEADKNEGRYKMSALSYSNEAERSADVITTTYLNDEHRDLGTTLFCNLKNRDNPLFKPFQAAVDFSCRRIYNLDSWQGTSGSGISVDDHDAVVQALSEV